MHPYQMLVSVQKMCGCNLKSGHSNTYAIELGQYTNISIYRNTDNRNIVSIHPIKVSIYRNIVIYRNISTHFREY